jgi:SAM-dependent methyltransferase
VHDTGAPYYDFVYDECFGALFHRLTDETLALIRRTQPAPARVLDLGAGTGRIAIPLAQGGYDVTAVERSPGMARLLAQRASRLGLDVALHVGDFRSLDMVLPPPDGQPSGPTRFDVALAIFTVLNYLVAEEDLSRLAESAAARVRAGGHLVFDLAERRLFSSALFESERLHREIAVEEIAPDTFSYRDSGCGSFEGRRFHYDDRFTLRYWRDDEVLWQFARHGLVLAGEVTERLRETGSRWFVLRHESAGC